MMTRTRKLVSALTLLLLAFSVPSQAQDWGGFFGPARTIRYGTSDPATCAMTGNNIFLNQTTLMLRKCIGANVLVEVSQVAQPVATVGLTAAVTTQNLYSSAPAGQYEVCWVQHITRAATTSSSLQTTIGWNNGSAKTSTLGSLDGGAFQTAADTTNVLNSTMSNCLTLWSSNAQNITYAVAYSSTGATTMQYSIYAAVRRIQ